MDLATAFALTVARRPDAVAVVDGERRASFSQWQAESARLAGGLARLGLRAGDHLLVVLKNRYENTALYWACHMLGIVYTPLNWRAGAADIAFCLADAEARAVAFEGASALAVREALAGGGLDALPRRRSCRSTRSAGGTAARHQVGADTQVTLPRDALWAYRDQGTARDE